MPVKLTSEQYKRHQHLKQVVILRKAGLSIKECADVLGSSRRELQGYLRAAAERGEYVPEPVRRDRWINTANLPYGVKRWLVAESRKSGVTVEEMIFAIVKDAHAEETQRN